MSGTFRPRWLWRGAGFPASAAMSSADVAVREHSCTMQSVLASFGVITPRSLFGQPPAYASVFSRGRASLPRASEAALNRGLLSMCHHEAAQRPRSWPTASEAQSSPGPARGFPLGLSASQNPCQRWGRYCGTVPMRDRLPGPAGPGRPSVQPLISLPLPFLECVCLDASPEMHFQGFLHLFPVPTTHILWKDKAVVKRKCLANERRQLCAPQ